MNGKVVPNSAATLPDYFGRHDHTKISPYKDGSKINPLFGAPGSYRQRGSALWPGPNSAGSEEAPEVVVAVAAVDVEVVIGAEVQLQVLPGLDVGFARWS